MIWALDRNQLTLGGRFSKHFSTILPSGNRFISIETLRDAELTVRFLNDGTSGGKTVATHVRRGARELMECFFLNFEV